MLGRVLFSTLLVSALAFGADDSNEPGKLNMVLGAVYLDADLPHFDDDNPTVMAAGQHLRASGGNAEMFSTAESMVRLGTTAEIELVSANEETSTIRLIKGSIIVDAYKIKKSSPVTIIVGDTETIIASKGEYRFDAKEDNASSLQVLKGKATLATGGNSQELKKKQMAAVTGGAVAVEKFDDFPSDALTIWHRRRAETVGAAVYDAAGYFGMGDLPDASSAGITR